jgi:hypothetical protein
MIFNLGKLRTGVFPESSLKEVGAATSRALVLIPGQRPTKAGRCGHHCIAMAEGVRGRPAGQRMPPPRSDHQGIARYSIGVCANAELIIQRGLCRLLSDDLIFL